MKPFYSNAFKLMALARSYAFITPGSKNANNLEFKPTILYQLAAPSTPESVIEQAIDFVWKQKHKFCGFQTNNSLSTHRGKAPTLVKDDVQAHTTKESL